VQHHGPQLSACSSSDLVPQTFMHGLSKFVRRFADGRRIAVWRSLLAPTSADAASPAEAQKALLQLRRQPPRWAVVVSSGGHFAAAIFAMAPPLTGKQQPKAEPPLFEVTAHKTFHRYVVR
jgi:Bacteroidetes VLRF1 release factor